MIGPSNRIWLLLFSASLILSFGQAQAQQNPPNPYLMGSEGYYKGPRGLTSYQPIAIDQPFAALMAHDVAAKPAIESEHQALLEERYDLGDHPAQGVTMERASTRIFWPEARACRTSSSQTNSAGRPFEGSPGVDTAGAAEDTRPRDARN